jgi:hypothetical protein
MVKAGVECPSRSDTTLKGHAGFEEHGGVGMPQVVQADGWRVGGVA